MAIGDPYLTLDGLKSWMGAKATDTTRDTEMTAALAAISREVEKITGRQFNDAGATSLRRFAPASWCRVDVDDFSTTTGLVVETDDDGDGDFETTWDSSDFELYPLDGVVDGVPGWPYDRIEAVAGRLFPCRATVAGAPVRRARVRVTAQWGWAAVPDPVIQAVKIAAAEVYKLNEAPWGVAGMAEYGVIRVRENPMARALLAPYERVPVGLA